MGYFFRCICLGAWVFLFGLPYHAQAQRYTHEQLQAICQQLLKQPLSTEKAVVSQIDRLTSWQRQWQQYRYPPDSTYINSLLQLGVDYLSLTTSDYPKATQAVRQAVRLSQARRPDIAPDQAAKALYRLGMLLTEQNEPAIDVLRQAVVHGSNIRAADRWVSSAYLYLAYAYYSAGDFQQAIDNAENGEQTARRTPDKALRTKLLQEKAKALNMLQQYDLARKAAGQAVALAEQDTFPALTARAYQLLGLIAQYQNQLDDALTYCERAFHTALPNDPTRPNYAVEVGILYYKLHQYDQAIRYFQYGVAHNTNAFARAHSLNQLGLAYWRKKDHQRALTYYQLGLTSLPIGFKNLAVTSLPDAQAIRQADQKDYLLRLIQDKADTWLEYAKGSNNNRQRLQYALDTYKVADQMIDFMRWEHTGQLSKLFWRQKTRTMYERAIETCYLLQDTEQAFRFLEKSRAVMLADKLNELGAQQQLTPQQIAEEQRLRQLVSDQQAKLTGSLPDDPGANTARMNLVAKQDSLTSFLKKLEESNPLYYRYKYDNSTVSIADLQQYLRKHQSALLTYFVGDSALYLLSVTTSAVRLLKQPVWAYNQSVDQFAPLLARPEWMRTHAAVNRFLSLSHNLYQQLLAPLDLPKGRVVVTPDGFFIPFDALSRSASQPQYVVADYAFSYAYSASLLLKRVTKPWQLPRPQTGDFLGIAPVDFSSSLKQVMLSGSDAALSSIAGRFHSPTLLTHKAATRRAFQREAPAHSVVLLFSHATADSSGQEPMLYFADSTLRLSELGDRSLPNAQLVVLAACKTGIGANQQGEGVFSLARGFSALGVPSVLTTLWSVENKATYQLTNLFFEFLDEGLPKDMALQRAKQEWLKTAEGANQLPNYWAGLIVVGDTAPLSRMNNSLWLAVAVIIALAGLGSWWYSQTRRFHLPKSRFSAKKVARERLAG